MNMNDENFSLELLLSLSSIDLQTGTESDLLSRDARSQISQQDWREAHDATIQHDSGGLRLLSAELDVSLSFNDASCSKPANHHLSGEVISELFQALDSRSNSRIQVALASLSPENFLYIRNELNQTIFHLLAKSPSAESASVFLSFLTVKVKDELLMVQDADGRTFVHYCAESGNVELLSALSNQSSDKSYDLMSIVDSQEQTALHVAAQNEHSEIAKLMISSLPLSEKDDLILARDCLNMLALHYAAENGLFSFVEMLVDSCSTERRAELLASAGAQGRTALIIAAQQGYDDIVQLILNTLGENTDSIILHKDYEDMTALHHSAESGHKTIGMLLLTAISLEKKDELCLARDIRNRIAMHIAAWHAHQDFALALLSSIGPSHKDELLLCAYEWKMTLLHWAAEMNNSHLASWLIDQVSQANKIKMITAKDFRGRTPLHSAADCGNLQVAIVLLKFGSIESREELVLQEDHAGRTALHYAATNGQDKLLEILLLNMRSKEKKDRLIWIKDSFGMTALHWGAVSGHRRATSVICSKASDAVSLITLVDTRRMSALHYAAFLSDELLIDFIKLLKNSDEKPSASLTSWVTAKDAYQNTPLHYAALFRRHQSLKAVMECLEQHDWEYCLYKLLNVEKRSPFDLVNADDSIVDLYRRRIGFRLSLNKSKNDLELTVKLAKKLVNSFYMSKDHPGTALVLMNTVNRPGWELELGYVLDITKHLGLNVVPVSPDLPAQDMIDAMRRLGYSSSGSSSLWVFIMSHGSSGCVLQCSNGQQIHLQDLLDALDETASTDTPKVVLAQFCREYLEGEPKTSFSLPDENYLVLMSTGSNSKAIRGELLKQFSNSIQSITDDTTLGDLVTSTISGTVKGTSNRQVPESISNMGKNLYVRRITEE